jgi:hypothetical protein
MAASQNGNPGKDEAQVQKLQRLSGFLNKLLSHAPRSVLEEI